MLEVLILLHLSHIATPAAGGVQDLSKSAKLCKNTKLCKNAKLCTVINLLRTRQGFRDVDLLEFSRKIVLRDVELFVEFSRNGKILKVVLCASDVEFLGGWQVLETDAELHVLKPEHKKI